MGMLIHHTWLEQQKEKPAVQEGEREEVPVEKTTESEPVRKGGRRKSSK